MDTDFCLHCHWRSNYQEVDWDPINQFYPPYFCVCPKPGPACSMSYVMVTFDVEWFEVRGGCLCWMVSGEKWLFVLNGFRWEVVVCVEWFQVRGGCLCWMVSGERWLFVLNGLRWEVVVCVEWFEVRGGCLFWMVWGERWLFVLNGLRWEVVVCCVDIDVMWVILLTILV